MDNIEKASSLGIPEITPDFGFSGGGTIFPYEEVVIRHKGKMVDESRKKQLMTRLIEEQVKRFIQSMAELQKESSNHFLKVSEHLERNNKKAKGKDYESNILEFNTYLAQLAAQQLFGAVKGGGASMAWPSLTPPIPPKPPKPKGLLARLLPQDEE